MTKKTYQLLKITTFKTLFLFSFCTIFLLPNSTIAQNPEITINTTASKEKLAFISESNNTDEIEIFIDDVFDKKNDTILGLAYCKVYLERGKKQNNYEIQYFSSYRLAYMYYLLSDYSKAIRYGNLSVKIADKLKDTTNSISSNSLLGSALYVIGNYDDALKPYLTAKKLSNLTDDSSYEILCLTNIVNIRLKLYRFEDALKNYNEVLSILKEKDSSTFPQHNEIYLSATLGKGLTLSELGKLEEAEGVYNEGIAFSIAQKDKKYEGFFNINLGDVYYKKGLYHKSLEFLEEAKLTLRNFSDLQNNKFIADFFIAKNYKELERYDEAIALLDTNFKRIGDKVNMDKIEEMYQLAIDVSEIQGNKEKILVYTNKQVDIIKARRKNKLVAKDLLYEDDIKDMVIENEKLTNEKRKTQVDKSIILTVSIILVSLILLFFLSYHRKTKQKEQTFLAIIKEVSETKKTEATQKVAQVSKIKDEKAKAILEKLHELETTEFYLSQDVTLHKTAKLLNTNTSYLSKALNAVEKQSFSQYLNKLRIDYVLVKLKEDAVFRSYTIHAISTEIGYKSATTFIKEFKNKTGLNPSYYIKKIED